MSWTDFITAALCSAGALFFLAGTVGLLRFPDIFCRLHALTKADNLGLGFIVLGLLFQAESVAAGAKLVLIWLLVLAVGSNACYALGRYARERKNRGGEEAPE